jgi:hypothetical protein
MMNMAVFTTLGTYVFRSKFSITVLWQRRLLIGHDEGYLFLKNILMTERIKVIQPEIYMFWNTSKRPIVERLVLLEIHVKHPVSASTYSVIFTFYLDSPIGVKNPTEWITSMS